MAEFAQYLERTGVSGIATCPFVYRAFSSRRCSMRSLGSVLREQHTILQATWLPSGRGGLAHSPLLVCGLSPPVLGS